MIGSIEVAGLKNELCQGGLHLAPSRREDWYSGNVGKWKKGPLPYVFLGRGIGKARRMYFGASLSPKKRGNRSRREDWYSGNVGEVEKGPQPYVFLGRGLERPAVCILGQACPQKRERLGAAVRIGRVGMWGNWKKGTPPYVFLGGGLGDWKGPAVCIFGLASPQKREGLGAAVRIGRVGIRGKWKKSPSHMYFWAGDWKGTPYVFWGRPLPKKERD